MALSPMMKHYLQVKEKHPDCLVFYRLGDFYEMFFDDAIKASELLDLTLTGRDCGLSERAPMCGIPYHASEMYISKLVSMGEKVAICEQLTEPVKGGLVERDVVRIVTAGTVINSELIDEKNNNFISCVTYSDNNKPAVSWADITTGEFYVRTFDDLGELVDYLIKISPTEIICDDGAFEIGQNLPYVKHNVLPKFVVYSAYAFKFEPAESVLKAQFGVSTLKSFGLENAKSAVCSAGALLSYLKETQKHAIKNITKIENIIPQDYMVLDATAIKNLELVRTLRDDKKYGSLLWLLDKTSTNMGARKLQSFILSPLNNANKINERLDAVEFFYKTPLIRQGISDLLKSVKDIGRLTGKISNGNLMPKDCLALCSSLETLPSLKFHLSGIDTPLIKEINKNIDDFSDVAKLLRCAINPDAPATLKDGGYINKGFNEELDEYRDLSKNGQSKIAEIEAREREETGIKTLRIRYNRVFGYYIEVTNSFKDLVPYTYQRRQTIANAERFVTEELKDVENKILNAEEKSLRLENELYTNIKSTLFTRIEEFNSAADAIALLDVINTFALIAKENNYVKPVITTDDKLSIVGGRHPVVEAISKEAFIPNDSLLDCDENQMLILTGPNMAGKSTYMRQVALITLMAHIGCFVPASKAEIPLTDKIFTRIGASDNLILDQSTFMVEMTEVATILRNATKNSLVILDEIGRGTSTYDGLSIAWAVVEYITKNIKSKTLFATHYHELSELEGNLYGVKNYKVTVKELNGTVVFLRKIMRGGANRSFGIEVAELAGIDKNITLRAKEILKQLERKSINKKTSLKVEEDVTPSSFSEVENIIKDINIDNITPMQAFAILVDLKEKIKK